jgi:uncharacterized DUF497 family protein
MEFEFDPAKSKANAAKHGIDFVTAQELWRDPDVIGGQANPKSEPRWMLIAKLENKIWSAIFTVRGENIRIISVRAARDDEREAYENQQDENDGGEP